VGEECGIVKNCLTIIGKELFFLIPWTIVNNFLLLI
jgi:hypothetical protein